MNYGFRVCDQMMFTNTRRCTLKQIEQVACIVYGLGSVTRWCLKTIRCRFSVTRWCLQTFAVGSDPSRLQNLDIRHPVGVYFFIICVERSLGHTLCIQMHYCIISISLPSCISLWSSYKYCKVQTQTFDKLKLSLIITKCTGTNISVYWRMMYVIQLPTVMASQNLIFVFL